MISPIRRVAHSFSTKPFVSSFVSSPNLVDSVNVFFSPASEPVIVTVASPGWLYRPTHTSCSP